MMVAQSLAPHVDLDRLFAGAARRPPRVTADSRQVRPGDAFAAFPGTRADGRAHIAEAIDRGAAFVLWESAGFAWDRQWRVPNAGVAGLRERLGAIADELHGRPSHELWIVGITGTNGKTTCAQWIAQCLDRCDRRCAVVGTLGNGFVGALAPSLYTTPDAALMHETLARLRGEGARAVAMEVSSHGLAQGRVNAIAFDVAVFTNLTRDHLDYHGTLEEYGAAKARLFAWPGLSTAVINADDAFGATLAGVARANGVRLLTYGSAAGEIRAMAQAATADGVRLSVATPWGDGELAAPVAGAFNAMNLLAVLGALLASEVPLAPALAALSGITPPPGRMQRLGGGSLPLVVVDYAHSPDALAKVLAALRPAVAVGRRLVCVFGCGGDRDRGKRPQMGDVAARLADRVIVTSDNPRSEDPALIAEAVATGIRGTANRDWAIELDRAAAIDAAVAAARPGDVVLLAGKGHEDYQERNGVRAPFSDARRAAAALAAWSGA
jgi:UDP-N-acetylmuramyl-tripeptide synthetase